MTKKEAKYFASYIMVRAFTQFFLHTPKNIKNYIYEIYLETGDVRQAHFLP